MAGRRSLLQRLVLTPLLLSACGREPQPPVLAAGRMLPPFELPSLDGRPVPVGGGGKPLLINFWATWCAPCRAEMAGLDRLYGLLGSAGLGLYGISVDDDINMVREFVLQQRIGFPILHDRGGAVTLGRFGIRAFPTTVLVRRDGSVAEVAVGERVWDDPSAQAAARALF